MVCMSHGPVFPTTVPFEVVGTVAVVDLEAACQLYGRDMLPFPLGRSRPVGSVWLATREAAPIEARLNGGDLHGIRAWVEAVVRADVCVECRVNFLDESTPDLRVHGVRADYCGFLAVQGRDREGVDVVDIYRVSPGALGPAVAETAGLVGPGAHTRIAVSGDGIRLPDAPEIRDEYDEFGFLIPRAELREPAVPIVDGRDVVATGTVRPRSRGTDAQRMLQWVQVSGDGDYLYEPGDAGYAEPMDTAMLTDCIDGLIADELHRMN